MERSANLNLPYIMPSQAQANVTHNAALDMLDALVQLGVESATETAPSSEPANGARFIVPPDASGAWATHPNEIALFRDGGWFYVTPPAGALAWVKDASALHVRSAGGWTHLDGSAAGELHALTLGINAAASAEQRFAVASDATLFDEENGSHRMLVNKAEAADTASIVFQKGYEARAEVGLAGDDDFRLKVTPDGATWHDALVAARATGLLSAPNGLHAPGHVLQMKTARLTTAFTTTSTTPQETGLAVSITPTGTNSKIVVRASVVAGAAFWQTAPRLAIYRDGDKIWPSSESVFLRHQLLADSEANSRLVSFSVPIEFEDEPGTGAITYSLRLAGLASGHNVHINRREFSSDILGESNISATEIGG